MSRRRNTVYTNLPRHQEPAQAAKTLADFVCCIPSTGTSNDANNKKKPALQVSVEELRKEFIRELKISQSHVTLTVYAAGRPDPTLWRMKARITSEQGAIPLVASATVTAPKGDRAGSIIITMDSSPAFPESRWNELVEAAQQAIKLINEKTEDEDTSSQTESAPDTLAELMRDQSVVIAVTHDDESPDENDLKTAQTLTSVAKCVTLDAAAQVRLLRRMDQVQSTAWLKSSLLWLSQDLHDPESVHVSALPNTPNEAIEAAKQEIAEIESTTEFAALRIIQQALDNLATQPSQHGNRPDPIEQQRFDTLTDQVRDKEETVRRQSETIARLTNELDALRTANNGASATDRTTEPVPEVEKLNETIVRNSSRWPHLIIMDSLLDSAATGHPCLPNGTEMIRILDSMEKLGAGLAQSADEKVGTFLNHFEELTGWKYSRGESERTLQQHGTHRWFKHQGESRMCQRHLTKPGKEHSVQVYFDKEPGLGLAVAYVGPHLPITSRS